jgi:hypothetical protein
MEWVFVGKLGVSTISYDVWCLLSVSSLGTSFWQSIPQQSQFAIRAAMGKGNRSQGILQDATLKHSPIAQQVCVHL